MMRAKLMKRSHPHKNQVKRDEKELDLNQVEMTRRKQLLNAQGAN
jgi:hypothetical protein